MKKNLRAHKKVLIFFTPKRNNNKKAGKKKANTLTCVKPIKIKYEDD